MTMFGWRLLLTIPLALAFAGCAGNGDDDDTADTGVTDTGANDPCLEPNFTSIYEDRLVTTKYCAGVGCHDSATASGGQDYSKSKDMVHATLLAATVNPQTDLPTRVVPGNPDSSFFWIKLSRNDAELGRMPLGLSPLQQCDLDAIKTWIMNGAAND